MPSPAPAPRPSSAGVSGAEKPLRIIAYLGAENVVVHFVNDGLDLVLLVSSRTGSRRNGQLTTT